MQQEPILKANTLVIDRTPGSEELAKTLNQVIAKCLNSRNEFLTFAKKVDDEGLFKLCMNLKNHRDTLALDLQHRVAAIGYEPATEEDLIGWLHRKWTRARLAVESGKNYAVSQEMQHEEESFRLALNDSLESGILPDDLRNRFLQEIELSKEILATTVAMKEVTEPKDYVDLNKK